MIDSYMIKFCNVCSFFYKKSKHARVPTFDYQFRGEVTIVRCLWCGEGTKLEFLLRGCSPDARTYIYITTHADLTTRGVQYVMKTVQYIQKFYIYTFYNNFY